MNFRQIEAFRAVMTVGSVSKAGDMLHISQPAVSRLIADLERNLNVALFERDRGRLIPTSEAHLLFQDAEMAFAGLERLSEAAEALRTLRRGRIRMVSETVFAEGFLPRLISRYQQTHPEVSIELDIGPSARVANWVSSKWYDLGLVVLPIAEPEVTVRPYARHNAVCVLNRAHRLARNRLIELTHLDGELFVSLAFGSPFRVEIDRAFEEARAQRVIRTEARTQHGICAIVAEGGGISIVDPCVAQDVRDPNLVFRPLKPAITWDLALLLPSIRIPSLVSRDFLSFICNSEDR